MAAKPKVLLVGNYREDEQHSMLGFGKALSDGLRKQELACQHLAPRRVVKAPIRRLDKWFAYLDKYVLFPRVLRQAARRADVVHILDQGNGIYVNHLKRVAHVVTCHDLLAIRSALGELPYWQTGGSGCIYQKLILRALRRASFVACVSGATYRDAQRLLSLPQECLTVIPNGLYDNWQDCKGVHPPQPCQDKSVTPGAPFVLHVGNASPYKNRAAAILLIDAIRQVGGPSKLVLAGGPVSQAERALVNNSGSPESIIEFNRPTGSDLEWLYSNAWALLVTSFDEGFGLPILEAQACGCPVFIPAKEPMTEVGGAGVVTIDPTNLDHAACVILETMHSATELISRGHKNVAKFSRDEMIRSYTNLYMGLAGRGES